MPAQQARGPVGHPVLLRRRLQRRRHDRAMVMLAWTPRSRLIVQPVQAGRRVTLPPADHRRTRHPNPLARSLCSTHPSAASNTIRARCASPARPALDRTIRVNRSRSPSRNPNAGAGRFAMPHHPNQASVKQLTTRCTSSGPAHGMRGPHERAEALPGTARPGSSSRVKGGCYTANCDESDLSLRHALMLGFSLRSSSVPTEFTTARRVVPCRWLQPPRPSCDSR